MHKNSKEYVVSRTEKCCAFLLKGKKADGKERELEMFVDYHKAM